MGLSEFVWVFRLYLYIYIYTHTYFVSFTPQFMGVALNQAVQWDWMPAWRYRCCIVLTLGPSMTQFRLAQKVETPPIYSRNFLGLFEVTCYFPVGNPPFGQSIVFFVVFRALQANPRFCWRKIDVLRHEILGYPVFRQTHVSYRPIFQPRRAAGRDPGE